MDQRELDRFIAREVMGWNFVADADAYAIGWNGASVKHANNADRKIRWAKDFRPSSDKEHAMEVYSKMTEGDERQSEMFRRRYTGFNFQEVGPGEKFPQAKTDPIGICMAALETVRNLARSK